MRINFEVIYESCNKRITLETSNGMIFLLGTPLTIVAREISVVMDTSENWPSWKFAAILQEIIHLSPNRDVYIAYVYQHRTQNRLGASLWSGVSSLHIQPAHITCALQCGHENIKLFVSSAYRRLLQLHGSSEKVQELITLAIEERWLFTRGDALDLLHGFVVSCQIQCRACTDIMMSDMVLEGTLFLCVARRDRILLALLFLCEDTCEWLIKVPPVGSPVIFTRISDTVRQRLSITT